MPAPNLGGDGKEEVVGEEALEEFNLSQGESFTVNDLESLETLQAELDRLNQGDGGAPQQIEIVQVKGEVHDDIDQDVETHEDVESHEVVETHEEVETTEEIETSEVMEHMEEIETTEEIITTEEVENTETEIITEFPLHEEEVESSENIIEVISTEEVEEAVETVEAIETVETIEETEEPHSDGKAVKSSDTIVTTQPLNVIKNAFNFPGQIMKVTVSGGQIVSTKMIGQFSPKTVSANSTATTTKTTPATSNIMHVKPVKKVAVQPKPVSFQTVQNLRTFSKPVGIKRAASSSIDQSRNHKVLINSDMSPQPVIIASEAPGSKAVGVSTASNIKIISGVSLSQSPNKTITLVQGSGKLQQIVPSSPQKSIVVNKIGATSPKKVTLMKSPSKILPAPGPQTKGGKIAMQKIFLRQGNSLKPATFLGPGQQVIRLQNPQNIVPSAGVSNLGTLHQIRLPGSNQVQLVRVVGAGGSTASVTPTNSQATVVSVTTALPTASSSEVKTFPVTILPAPTTAVSASGSGSSPSILTLNSLSSNNGTSTSGSSGKPLRPKIVSIAPAKATSSGNVLYTMPSQSGNVTQVSSGKTVNVVMLPTQYIQQVQQENKGALNSIPIAAKFDTANVAKEYEKEIKIDIKTDLEEKAERKHKTSTITTSHANGIRPRKPCNCTRSQCLKLYCDCFASGEFCYQCNCNSCFNNLEHEEDRQLAIKSCLERNPNAFRPKIGRTYATDTERRHTKGCNCKRSGCLKNYCECYEAKIPCSHNCKCVGCRNVEDGMILRRHRDELREEIAAQSLTALATIADDLSSGVYQRGDNCSKISSNMFSTDVLEASVQCLLAQAYEAQEQGLDKVKSQQLLLEEYGRCLKSIIEYSSSDQDLT